LKINWDNPLPAREIKKHIPRDVILRIKYVKDNLTYAHVYSHYGYEWISNETHQLSCVFHARHRDAKGRPYEDSPSARYYEHDRQIYCFACAEGGDVVWFIMKHERLPNTIAALDYIERAYGIGINTQNLSKRIEALKTSVDIDDKRKILSTLYQDQVNDLIYKLKKAAPLTAPHLERVQLEAIKAKSFLDQQNVPYSEYVKVLRTWRDQVMGLIDSTVKDVQRGLLK
jgi:uncharacterized protein YktA (UPF0223 family)